MMKSADRRVRSRDVGGESSGIEYPGARKGFARLGHPAPRQARGRSMKSPMNTLSLFAWIALLSLGFSATRAQNAPNAPESMRFFVTSAGSGKGGDLGGLTGADAHCQSLAAAVGAGARTWHAYLSTQTGAPAVNARDRIGHGPWYNAKGTLIARDLDELHGTNMLTKQTALTEKGAMVNGRGDTPNMHDILTGWQPDGKASPPNNDRTCKTCKWSH